MMDGTSERELTIVAQHIAEYVRSALSWEGTEAMLLAEDATPLPAELDSVQLLELAGFVEDEYAIALDEDDLTAENFESVRALAGLVLRKRG
jgi:acyl carrier protein